MATITSPKAQTRVRTETRTGPARLPRRARLVVLTVHVVTSVAWLGGAYTSLLITLIARATGDATMRDASYRMIATFDWAMGIPLGLVAITSGVVLSVGTHWGLLRYRWVIAKMVLTAAAFVAPLVVRRPAVLDAIAEHMVADITFPSVMAVLVLTAATALSTVKPGGRTARGRRAAERRRAGRSH